MIARDPLCFKSLLGDIGLIKDKISKRESKSFTVKCGLAYGKDYTDLKKTEILSWNPARRFTVNNDLESNVSC
jgi:hypothetical protein